MNNHPRWPWSLRTSLVFGLIMSAVTLLSLATLGCDPDMPPSSDTSKPTLRTHNQAIINGDPDLTQPAIGAITIQKGSPFCTGTLLSSRLVVTAAHCIVSAQQEGASKIYFRVDFPDPPNKFRSEYYQAAQLLHHPQYTNGSGANYDIGLIILQQKVANATPIPALRTAMDQAWVGNTVRVVGYGQIQTRPTIQSADQKYAADIPLYKIDTRSFIHLDTKTKKSACHGDSGGPALYKVFGRNYVVGVTSVAYQAQPYPGRPGQTYCDGGAISTRTDTAMDFLRPYLIKYADGPEPCQSDAECGACATCPSPPDGQQQVCVPKPITPESTTCQACTSNKDCGSGLCHRFPTGYRCLQPCTQDSCCPAGNYCNANLAGAGAGQRYCFPLQDTCPDLTCQQDSDCGPGEGCTQGLCKPQPPPRSASYCQPCHSSSQCGAGNFCYNSTTTQGYCVQACGKGRFCPSGSTCQTIAPGVEQCMPDEGCFQACKLKEHCSQGYECQKERCVRPQGGTAGDFCNKEATCAPGYRCTKDDYGSRCLKTCGSPAGAAGNACNKDNCADGLTCVSFSSVNICLEQCTSTCKTGGQCYRLSRDAQFCLCQTDSDCGPNQFCNYAIMGTFGAGACSPKPPNAATQCRPGENCEAHPPAGNFCRPKVGDRPAFATCSYLNRCTAGLDCLQLTSQYPAVCYESCQLNGQCTRGGTCITFRGGAKYCMCQNSSQCPTGTTCRIVARSGQGDVGFCDRSTTQICTQDNDCPAEHICSQNACVFDAAKSNEPWPQTHPELPPTDAGPELPQTDTGPIPEPIPEPKIGIEPGPEPVATVEQKQVEEKNKQPTTELPTTPPGGCGCDQTSGRPTRPSPLLGLLLLGFLLLRRRKA